MWLCLCSYTQLLNETALTEHQELDRGDTTEDVSDLWRFILIVTSVLHRYSLLGFLSLPWILILNQFYSLFCYGGSDEQKADEGSEEEGGGDATGNTGAMDEEDRDEVIESPKEKVCIVSMRYCTNPL